MTKEQSAEMAYAVDKRNVLETYADLYDVFEDNKAICDELNKVYDRLNALPAVEPRREKGEWLGKPLAGFSTVRCSNCRAAFRTNSGTWNFCPDCGANMKGGQDETD